jgi:hypothetical protein
MKLVNGWDIISKAFAEKEENTKTLPEYQALKNEFDNALQQAQGGKGKERHARENQYFEDQVMCQVQRLLIDHPLGGLAYQVIKKTIESGRLYNDKGIEAAIEEIYGAMNYLGGMSILYDEMGEEEEDYTRCSWCGGELNEIPTYIYKEFNGQLYCPNCDPINTEDVGC